MKMEATISLEEMGPLFKYAWRYGPRRLLIVKLFSEVT